MSLVSDVLFRSSYEAVIHHRIVDSSADGLCIVNCVFAEQVALLAHDKRSGYVVCLTSHVIL